MTVQIGNLIIFDEIKSISLVNAPEGESNFVIVTTSQSYNVNFPFSDLTVKDLQNYIDFMSGTRLEIGAMISIATEHKEDVFETWKRSSRERINFSDEHAAINVSLSYQYKKDSKGRIFYLKGAIGLTRNDFIAPYPDMFFDIMTNFKNTLNIIYRDKNKQKRPIPILLAASGTGVTRNQINDFVYGALPEPTVEELTDIIRSYFKIFILSNS